MNKHDSSQNFYLDGIAHLETAPLDFVIGCYISGLATSLSAIQTDLQMLVNDATIDNGLSQIYASMLHELGQIGDSTRRILSDIVLPRLHTDKNGDT